MSFEELIKQLDKDIDDAGSFDWGVVTPGEFVRIMKTVRNILILLKDA